MSYCPKCRKLARYDRPSASMYCANCNLHICPTCSAIVRYMTSSDTWFCDKCKKDAKPNQDIIDQASIMEGPAVLWGEVPAKGSLELTRTTLRFRSEFSGTVNEVPVKAIKEMGTSHVKPSAGQIASGLFAFGIIGGVYAATVDNALGISYVDSQGKIQTLKFMLEDPRSWIENTQTILKEQRQTIV